MRLLPILVPALLATAGCAQASPPAMPLGAPSPAVGRTASVTLPSDQGSVVTLPLGRARATVVEAFSPTCEPCRTKVPALLALRPDIERAGGRIVLIAVLADGETTEEAAAALRRWGAESPFLVDRGDVVRRECGVESLPATIVLDARGVVRWFAGSQSSASDVASAASAVANAP
ncbi:MAG: TlpA disulfide reductase family protein [Polyangiaceae bacterium]